MGESSAFQIALPAPTAPNRSCSTRPGAPTVTTTTSERSVDAVAPLILNASQPEDRARLGRLRSSGRVWAESDGIRSQLRELAALLVRHVGVTPSQIDDMAERLLGRTPVDQYGRRVYFPWSGRLVNLLRPTEFRQLRLDRNRHKITDDEADRLAGFNVGVIGRPPGVRSL